MEQARRSEPHARAWVQGACLVNIFPSRLGSQDLMCIMRRMLSSNLNYSGVQGVHLQARAAGSVRHTAAGRGRDHQEALAPGALPPGAQPKLRRQALRQRQAVWRHWCKRLPGTDSWAEAVPIKRVAPPTRSGLGHTTATQVVLDCTLAGQNIPKCEVAISEAGSTNASTTASTLRGKLKNAAPELP